MRELITSTKFKITIAVLLCLGILGFIIYPFAQKSSSPQQELTNKINETKSLVLSEQPGVLPAKVLNASLSQSKYDIDTNLDPYVYDQTKDVIIFKFSKAQWNAENAVIAPIKEKVKVALTKADPQFHYVIYYRQSKIYSPTTFLFAHTFEYNNKTYLFRNNQTSWELFENDGKGRFNQLFAKFEPRMAFLQPFDMVEQADKLVLYVVKPFEDTRKDSLDIYNKADILAGNLKPTRQIDLTSTKANISKQNTEAFTPSQGQKLVASLFNLQQQDGIFEDYEERYFKLSKVKDQILLIGEDIILRVFTFSSDTFLFTPLESLVFPGNTLYNIQDNKAVFFDDQGQALYVYNFESKKLETFKQPKEPGLSSTYQALLYENKDAVLRADNERVYLWKGNYYEGFAELTK
jgi:hypothetical protein